MKVWPIDAMSRGKSEVFPLSASRMAFASPMTDKAVMHCGLEQARIET